MWGAVTYSVAVGPVPPMCKAESTTDQTIPTAEWTLVPWSAEEYDTDGMHSTSSNTERITFNTPGRYRVSAGVSFATNNTGLRAARLFRYDGVTPVVLAEEMRGATQGDDTSFTLTTMLQVNEAAVGKWLKLEVYQSSGGNLDLARSTPRVHMTAEWIGGKVV